MKRTAQQRTVLLFLVTAGLFLASVRGGAWDATRPQIAQQDSVINIEHSFVSDLSPDSVAQLLYRPNHLIAAEKGGPGVLEVAGFERTGYNVEARFSLLWIYRNRIVLHRTLEQHGDTLMVHSNLVDFWQTVGVAPDPASSQALYVVTPKPYGGTVVTYSQRTVFHSPLGSYAYRYFSNETARSLMEVVDYIHRFEPASVAER